MINTHRLYFRFIANTPLQKLMTYEELIKILVDRQIISLCDPPDRCRVLKRVDRDQMIAELIKLKKG